MLTICVYRLYSNPRQLNSSFVLDREQSILLDNKAMHEHNREQLYSQRVQAITRNYEDILKSMGEDTSRQG